MREDKNFFNLLSWVKVNVREKENVNESKRQIKFPSSYLLLKIDKAI